MTDHTIHPPQRRPDRPAWTRANDIGQSGERAVASLLIGIGIAITKASDLSADLQFAGRIEVKRDMKATTTGAVAIEVEYRSRPSGIFASSAATWAIVVGNTITLISLSRLRVAVVPLQSLAAGESARIKLLPLDQLRRLGLSIPIGGGR